MSRVRIPSPAPIIHFAGQKARLILDLLASTREIVSAAIREFGPSLAVLSSFQREDVIVTDLVLKTAPSTRILTLDTGRVPPSTNQIIAEIERRYSITV